MSSISSSSASSELSYLQQLYSNTTTTTTTSTSTSTSELATSPLSASDMFKKLSEEVGGDGKTISKSDLETYINTVKSDTTGKYDKGELGFLTQLDKNWDSISGGSDSITESDMASGMSYLQPPSSSSNSNALTSDLFSALSDALDSNSDSISLDDLTSYLKSLTSSNSSSTSTTTDTTTSTGTTTSSTSATTDTELTKEVNFIKDLIANFDDYSDNSGNISSSSLLTGMQQPQDPSTVTSEQLVSPINLRV